jgi:hypothetical protein
MSRLTVRLAAAAIVVAVSIGVSRSSDDPEPRAAPKGESTLSNTAPRACDLLTRRIAKDYLGSVRGEPRVSGGPSGRSCTYLSPSLNRGVSVSVYPAAEYRAAVGAMAEAKRAPVAGRRAMFNNRYGYLIRAPGKPYYLQVAFQHATHLHADRRMSTRLANTLLLDAPAPTGPFYCPVVKRRVV